MRRPREEREREGASSFNQGTVSDVWIGLGQTSGSDIENLKTETSQRCTITILQSLTKDVLNVNINP